MNLKKKYFTLSEPQKMIYWGELMHPGTSLNTMCATYELADQNNVEIMKSAILKVIQENPSLNIRIHQMEGVPYQYKLDNGDEEVRIVDFSKESDDIKEEEWISSIATSSFSFFNSKLYNFYLFYRYDSSLSLLICSHHIISDAWTHYNLACQIKDKYTQLLNNTTDIFNHKYSYIDYIKAEKKYLVSERSRKAREYWVSKFKDIDSFSSSVIKDDSERNPDSERFKLNFNSSLQNKILRVCNENNISYPTFFLSCLLVTLRRISGKSSHLLGTLSYNRLGAKEKEGVGMYVNTLPLYIDNTDDQTFRDIIDNANRQSKGILKHQRYPLSLITNDSELKRLNIAESIDIIYSYKNNMMPYEYTYQYNKSSIYPLVFRPSICEKSNKFYIDVDYQLSLFKEEYIREIGDVYTDVIESLAVDLNMKLDFKESNTESNNTITKIEHDCERSLHEIFEEKVAEYSDNVAVTYGDFSLTYKELNSRANYLAVQLVDLGCGSGKPVILMADRSMEMIIALLAILKTGSCYLPIGLEEPVKRVNKIVEQSGASLFIGNDFPGKDLLIVENYISFSDLDFNGHCTPNLEINVKPSDLAYIMYTSGSTGKPKGIMVEHRSVVNRLLWMQREFSITKQDSFLQKNQLTFDVSVWELLGWFFNGASMHLLQPGEEKEPEALINAIDRNRTTIIHFTPSMLKIFLEYLETGGSRTKIRSLNYVICSGEELNIYLVKQFKRLIGDIYDIKLYNLYGPTEAAIDVTSYIINGNESGFVPIGKPIDNVEIYILNKKGEVLPPGMVGELHIGGVCLSRGYLEEPDLTGRKFKFHESLGKELYSTGDIASFLDDGNIKFLGRNDFQVKVRDHRVELGEVETCLLRYPSITKSAVVALVDSSGNTYLGSYFVADHSVSHENLRHFIQEELPSYMVPSFFVQMESFPLTSNGKLDRNAFPEPENIESKGKLYFAPVNDREKEICEVWEDVLKIEKISRQDNFFDLGGDSLALIKVHFALQKRYEVELQQLFEYQTIESLSVHLHERKKKSLSFNEKSYKVIETQRKEAEKIKRYYKEIFSLKPVSIVEYKNVLITGATGYLGAYIAKEYLERSGAFLYLLVRGDGGVDATNRLREKFTYYFGQGYYNNYKDRIIVLVGDLVENNLGIDTNLYSDLSSKVDLVIHCAANVKHYGDKDDFNDVNVNATKSIIDFCKNRRDKKVIYISTISVGLSFCSSELSYHFTEHDSPEGSKLGNVYIDSKIMAEKLVQDSFNDLDGQIIRVGNIAYDTETGKFQENSNDNAFLTLLKAYKNRNSAPDIDIPFIDLSYVNETAQGIRILANSTLCGTFHVVNPDFISLKELCKGLNISTIPIRDFVSGLFYGDSLLTHGYYLERISLLNVIPYCDLTNSYLVQQGFKWSSVNFTDIEKILSI